MNTVFQPYLLKWFFRNDNKASSLYHAVMPFAFIGSDVLAEQVQEYADKMPYFTTIIQRGEFYTMTL